MTVSEAWRALVQEIERVFPRDNVAALTHPLAELEQAIIAQGDVTTNLDLLEDLLESLLREAGWPERAAP